MPRRPGKRQKPLTIEDGELTLDRLAETIDKHGDQYIPLYERMEREVDAMKAARATKNRISERIARNRHGTNQGDSAC